MTVLSSAGETRTACRLGYIEKKEILHTSPFLYRASTKVASTDLERNLKWPAGSGG